jgi:hypothetical protein
MARIGSESTSCGSSMRQTLRLVFLVCLLGASTFPLSIPMFQEVWRSMAASYGRLRLISRQFSALTKPRTTSCISTKKSTERWPDSWNGSQQYCCHSRIQLDFLQRGNCLLGLSHICSENSRISVQSITFRAAYHAMSGKQISPHHHTNQFCLMKSVFHLDPDISLRLKPPTT